MCAFGMRYAGADTHIRALPPLLLQQEDTSGSDVECRGSSSAEDCIPCPAVSRLSSLVAFLTLVTNSGVKPYLIMRRETCPMGVCEKILRCHNLGPLGLGHSLRCQVGLISVAKKGAARRFTRDPANSKGRSAPALSLVVSVTLHGVACVEFADGLRALSVARSKLRASRTTAYQTMNDRPLHFLPSLVDHHLGRNVRRSISFII
jgi:hypothetical protein